MATIYVAMNGAKLVFGAALIDVTPPDYTTGEDVSCQIIEARVQPATVTETAPATLCADEVDRTTGLKYTLEITAFQDWTDPEGMCWYLSENALTTVYFSLALPDAGWHAGQVELVPLQYGGAAGANLQGQVSLGVSNHQETPPPIVGTARRTTKKAAASAAA